MGAPWVGGSRWGVGVQESSRAVKPLHRRWWGHGALGSTLLVFSDAAGEAAELGEAGPDHGLEHQVGRGAGASMSPSRCSWRLWQMGPASHPSPEALAAAAGSFLLGRLRKSVPLPARSSWHPHMEKKRGRAGPLGWLSWCEVCPLSPWPPPGSCCENCELTVYGRARRKQVRVLTARRRQVFGRIVGWIEGLSCMY